jgi:hypothetical protein
MEEGIWWAVAEFRLFVACGMESGLRQWLRSVEACSVMEDGYLGDN